MRLPSITQQVRWSVKFFLFSCCNDVDSEYGLELNIARTAGHTIPKCLHIMVIGKLIFPILLLTTTTFTTAQQLWWMVGNTLTGNLVLSFFCIFKFLQLAIFRNFSKFDKWNICATKCHYHTDKTYQFKKLIQVC